MNIDVAQTLQRGRDSFGRRSWDEAFKTLARIDGAVPLGADDLERAATAAYLTGRDQDYLKLLERAHRAHQDAGERERAARCAFWLGLRFVFRGEMGPATGWFGRAHRLIEEHERDCVERGYVLLPLVEQHLMAGKPTAAYEAAANALAIGTRFHDPDLVAIALHLQGRALLREREVERGLALLDEAMVAVAADELSPIVTGLIYCSVIDACQQVCAFGRAGEWTAALASWCAEQPQLIAFTDRCLVHRSEVMQLHGAWDDAIAEAQRACTRLGPKDDRRAAAAAYYQQGEVHRLRGDFESAETAYRETSQWGGDPQPGLALLRLAQGRTDAAAAAIRRSAGATADPFRRVRLLPAQVEIMLAAHDLAEAHTACRELEELTLAYGTDALRALAAHARGIVELAEGKHREALNSLQTAQRGWHEFDVPYLAARARVEAALACRALGDDEGAGMELDAARVVFERLGAGPDVARIDALARGRPTGQSHSLTTRELQVLRILASGKTNKSIARELSLSEKTVDRHVSNIFNKLDVPSRAAATAYAYEHKLI
ncbi:MAG TPA: response regulator transcription factor [Xanthobacteraceae bacterium]|nr:response regulator transcription factor [Xanthobacteraceae bacterium]